MLRSIQMNKKYGDTEFVPVTIIISKLYSNKLMLGGSCFLPSDVNLFLLKRIALIKQKSVFIIVLLYLSREFQVFYYWGQFKSGHMYSFLNLT